MANYSGYIEYLTDLGWKYNHTFVTEKDDIVTTHDCMVASSGWVINMKCPPGEKISIKGTLQSVETNPYVFGCELCSMTGQEICPNTRTKVSKIKPTEDIIQLARTYYSDIKICAGFHFKHGIELNGEDELSIHVTADSPIGYPTLPDVTICSDNIKFSIEVDRWKK